MAFDGSFDAPKIVPSAFGLFSIFEPQNPEEEEKWVRGFYQQWETTPNYVRNWDETSATSYVVDNNPGAARYSYHIPFFIEAEDYASTFGAPGVDRFARVIRQLEGCTQKAAELELWDGSVALQGTGTDLINPYLSKGASVTILPGRTSAGAVADPATNGAAISVKHGVSVLEYQIGQYSSGGEQGWIHMSRDTAAVLSSYNQMVVDYYDPNKGSRQHLQTFGGTPLVVGSGYSGNGPVVNITTRVLDSNTVTLTTANSHGIAQDNYVIVTGLGAPFDGTWQALADTANKTIKYTVTNANIATSNPTGATAQMKADSRYKWIYASGEVRVYLGKPDVVNDNLAQGYDVTGNKNDMRIKATRAAAVYFDTSIHLGVKVDLTLTN
jgi:hypothetical protein